MRALPGEAVPGDALKPVERRFCRFSVLRLELGDVVDLTLFLFCGGTGQGVFRFVFLPVSEKGVHADDRQFARVFELFIIEGFLLNLAALVLRFHRAEHAAAVV